MAGKIYLAIDAEGVEHVFTDWPACQAYVHGKPFRFCSAADVAQARERLRSMPQPRPSFRGGSTSRAVPKSNRPNKNSRPAIGICSDAGTHGNPGPCEYQVADLSGMILKHEHLGVGTNNFAELSGIAAAIDVAIARGESIIWTDSQVCLGWIDTGRVGEGVAQRERVVSLVTQIRRQLLRMPQIKLHKWETRSWGEIPADFGRKS